VGGLIPLSDASRRPVSAPVVTALIVVAKLRVTDRFSLELRANR